MLRSLLSPTMRELLMQSIGEELYASSLYKSLANQNERLGFFGARDFYLKESADELTHYQRISDFMNAMGDMADIPKIEAIKDKITTIGEALHISYETELDLLNHYKEFYKKAEEEDCAVAQFLLQFIEIQRLSVGEFGDLISRYERCGSNEAAILEFDEYMKEN